MLLGKHYLFLFPSKTNKKFPSSSDQLSYVWEREGVLFFFFFFFFFSLPQSSEFLQPARVEMLEKVSNSQAKPQSITKFPSQLIETPVFLPASKIPLGNRFVGCP